MKYEKMDKSLSDLIETVVTISNTIFIESVVIDEHGARGQGDGLFITMSDINWDYGIDGIAFGDVMTLAKRLKMFDNPAISFMRKEKDSGYGYPYKMQMKKGGTAIEYICTNPTKVTAPKNIKDAEAFKFMMDKDAVEMISKSKQLMGSDNIIFSGSEDSVKLIANDVNSATLSHEVTTDVTFLTDTVDFVFPYKSKNIIGIMKLLVSIDDTFEVTITERGFMKLSVGTLSVYILREVL